jgi:hypothetical protein
MVQHAHIDTNTSNEKREALASAAESDAEPLDHAARCFHLLVQPMQFSPAVTGEIALVPFAAASFASP